MKTDSSARRVVCSYVLSTVFAALSPSLLVAAPIIDQNALAVDSNFGNPATVSNHISQTFTVGTAGLLSQIDLQLLRYNEATTPPTVQIRSTTGGVPGTTAASVLYETTVDLSEITLAPGPAGFLEPVSFDVSSAGIMVNPGDVLAISMQGASPGYPDWTLWTGAYGNPYPSGARYHRTSSGSSWNLAGDEYGFRTWVDPNPVEPPPPGPGVGDYTVFETALATPDHPMSNSGSTVSNSFFVGIGFNVERTTHVSQVGAFLEGNGSIFAAIVDLDNQFGVPSPPDLSGTDVLGTTLINLPGGFDGADAIADLSLTLEPGPYALVFGSGKFGATGSAFMRSTGHILNGDWSEYSLRQSDGQRFFQSGDRRMFVIADSAPGTVQIRPSVDLVAEITDGETVLLLDGDGSVFVGNSATGADPDSTALLQFSLADVPLDREITEVSLELDLNLLTHSGPLAFNVFGYAADGTPHSTDAITFTDDVGTTAFEGVGVVTVDLDPAFVQSLVGSATHLGLSIVPSDSGNFRFNTLEGGEFGEPPLLTIALAPPENAPGDFDGDGDVDGRDFLAWQRNPSVGDLADWQANYGTAELQAATSVPEPASAILVFSFLLAATRSAAQWSGVQVAQP